MKPKKLVREGLVKFSPDAHFERITDPEELNALYALKIKEELHKIQSSSHNDVVKFANLIDVAMSFAQENGHSLEELHEVSAIQEEKRGIYSSLALNNLMPNDPSNVSYFESSNKVIDLKSIRVPPYSEEYSINNIGCLRYVIRRGSVEKSSVIEPSQIGENLINGIHELVGCAFMNGSKYVLYRNK